MSLIGNSHIHTFFSRLIAQGTLSHAYLFVGPEHVGKRTAAEHITSMLIGDIPLHQYPDFFVVERTRDAKSGKLHNAIVLEQIHTLRGKLSMTALLSGWKVCLIDGVEMLNTEAANALLKSLEEPHSKTLFFLLTSSLKQVMPTIRSRCQAVSFARVPRQELRDALMSRSISSFQADLLAGLADGCPGRALTFAKNSEALNTFLELRAAVVRFPRMTLAQRFSVIEQTLPTKSGFQESLETAEKISTLTLTLTRDALLMTYGHTHILHSDIGEAMTPWKSLGRDRLLALTVRISEVLRLLSRNVQPRAVLEYMAMGI